jgi:hypothetical protein
MTREPSIRQPPFDIPPATRDENAPKSLPIRGVVDAETRRFIRGNAWACQRSRIKSGTVKPDDLAFELGAYR